MVLLYAVVTNLLPIGFSIRDSSLMSSTRRIQGTRRTVTGAELVPTRLLLTLSPPFAAAESHGTRDHSDPCNCTLRRTVASVKRFGWLFLGKKALVRKMLYSH
jgi:hypothetical protein